MGAGARLHVLVLLCVLAAPAPLRAQQRVTDPVVPDPGEEVRIVQRGARGAVHGLYVEADATEVVLRSIRGGGPIRIPRSEITGMSVQRGTRGHGWAGALAGIGVGVVAGVVLGQTTTAFDSTGEAVGISVGAALPIGLLIGLLIKSPEWDGVDMGSLSPRPRPWPLP